MGGYGTFGGHAARQLIRGKLSLTIAGRDLAKATAAAESLGNASRGIAVDVTDPASCRAALEGHRVAVNCAGPFSRFNAVLPRACLEAGCHYVDIAEDRRFVANVWQLGDQFADRNLTAAVGCSCLPGISGALAAFARQGSDAAVRRARATLFIGNNNPKGAAAVVSAAQQIGRRIAAPQGGLVGFRDAEVVLLPPPFGLRRVLNFDSPEYDLFPELIQAESVSVKVGFELRVVNAAFGLAAVAAPALGRALLPRLARCAGWLRAIGCSGGAVMVELFFGDGTLHTAAIAGQADGQLLAVLPAVYAAKRLAGNEPCRRGAVTAYELLGARELIDQLVADGFEFSSSNQ